MADNVYTDKARQMGYHNVANVADQEALRS